MKDFHSLVGSMNQADIVIVAHIILLAAGDFQGPHPELVRSRRYFSDGRANRSKRFELLIMLFDASLKIVENHSTRRTLVTC
jgi:hypothetical protein